MMNVERPVILGEHAGACLPTDSQRIAIDTLNEAIAEIREMDSSLHNTSRMERQVLGIGSREVTLFADRGMGKTSVLLTLAVNLEASPDCTVLWPPIDARALEDSETVMATTLARLAAKATDGLSRENPAELQECREWNELQQGAWKSHPMYARFVAASAASAPEFGAYLIDRSRGTERLREDVERCVERWLSRIRKKQCVIFVDDLDQSRGRAVEALLDLERYVAVPGLAFVFAFKYDALRRDVSHNLFGEHSEPAKTEETENFLRKTLPTDRRADLWAIPPEKRLAFAVRGRSVRELLLHAMPKDAWYLFDEGAVFDELSVGVHADLLPSTPRGLRTLFGSLPKNRNLQGGGGRTTDGPATRDGIAKILSVVEQIAQSEDVFPVLRLVTRLRTDLDSLGHGKRGLASDVVARVQAHLPAGVGDPAMRRMPNVPLTRDPVSGMLLPLARFGSPQTDFPINARWQELLWDVCIYLDRQSVWRTFEVLGFASDMTGPFLSIPEVSPDLPFRGWLSVPVDDTKSPGYGLTELLRNAAFPCLPDTVRRQEAYLVAINWLQRPRRARWAFQRLTGTKLSDEQLRGALQEMACLHVTALLIARGAPLASSPARDARRLADHIARTLRGRRILAPEVGAFLDLDDVKEVLQADGEVLREVCRALLS